MQSGERKLLASHFISVPVTSMEDSNPASNSASFSTSSSGSDTMAGESTASISTLSTENKGDRSESCITVDTVTDTLNIEKLPKREITKQVFSPSRASEIEPPKKKKFKVSGEGVGYKRVHMKPSVETCMKQITDEVHDVHKKWGETFKESEQFESVALMRVEALLKEAKAHKQKLEAEKEALIKRLKGVTSILDKSRSPPRQTQNL